MAKKSRKNYFSFSQFDELGDAMGLFYETIKGAFNYDSLEGKDVFDAIVLTEPIPMSIDQIDSFIPSPPSPGGVAGAARNLLGIDDDEIPKFIFKAKIIGLDSPHLFRPDVCDQEVLKELEAQQKVQDVLDMFIDVVAVGATEKPSKGNIIKVRLEPGTYKYNLQSCEYVGLVTDQTNTVTNIIASQTTECAEGAAAAFESLGSINYNGITVGDNATARGVSYTEHFDPAGPRLRRPAQGPIQSRFSFARPTFAIPGVAGSGRGSTRPHTGIDIGNAEGTKIVAAYDGRVKSVFTNAKEPQKGDNHGAGNYIEIVHNIGGQNYLTRYLHLLHTNSDKKDPNAKREGISYVTPGDKVTKGQVIALMGNTGGSTGPHLHFDLRKGTVWNKNPLDPEKHLEDNFEQSLRLLQEEKETGLLQAERDSIRPPLETETRLEEVGAAEAAPETPGTPAAE